MRFEAVIFDLDGTLLDTLGDIASAMNSALSALGFPGHTLDSYRYFVGSGMTLLVKRSLPEDRRDDETVAKALARMRAEYEMTWDRTSKPYPGIPGLLDRLAAAGVRIAILSNKPDDFTKRCVGRMMPQASFEVVAGAKDEFPSKPHPQGAMNIAAGLHMPPSSFAFVGDTSIDMETARAAGMFPVGVAWGFRPVKELQESGAAAIARDVTELEKLLTR